MRLFTPPLVAALLLGLVALSVALPRPQEPEYYDDEEEEAPPPPPPTPAPARNALNRGRLTAARKPVATKKATEVSTTAAPPPPPPETSEELADSDVPVTTTEAPKKYLIAGRNGVVRPFRSNDDLLAALKRRRNQVSTHSPPSTEEPASTTPSTRQSKSQRLSASSANVNGKRGRFGSNSPRVAEATQEVQEAPSVAPPRRSTNTFARRPALASRRVHEEAAPADEAEEPEEPRTSRFSPRRRV